MASGYRSGVLVEATTGFEPVNRGFADPSGEIMTPMAEQNEPDLPGLEPIESGVHSGVRRATLYRYYTAHGDLLYVGKTGVGQRRGSGHARSSEWWPHAAYAEFFHSDEWAVSVAERLAIWQECPMYNTALRVSTSERQRMLALLGPSRRILRTVQEIRPILALGPKEIRLAVDFGFLTSARRYQLLFAHEELARFIGERDERGTLDHDAEFDLSFRPRLVRSG